jgi:predicted branched-subunit amino acid permease
LAGNYFLNWGSWIVASLLGVGLANLIPPEWGLGFAGILCLLGIQCSLASSRMRMLSAAVAGVAAVMAYNLLGRRLARLDSRLEGLAFDLRALAHGTSR